MLSTYTSRIRVTDSAMTAVTHSRRKRSGSFDWLFEAFAKRSHLDSEQWTLMSITPRQRTNHTNAGIQ